jgi:transposase
VLGISKNTVKAALASDSPPNYERLQQGSIVDEVEPRIRELLQAYPRMPATVIAERIGWTRSIRVLSARVAELRPVYLPPDPASRTAYAAGEIAQCDFWFPDIEIPAGFGQTRTATRLPVLTMISAYSRWLLAMLIPTRCAEGSFRRMVATHRDAGRGAAGVGLGRRRRSRTVARRTRRAEQGMPGLRRTGAAPLAQCTVTAVRPGQDVQHK